MGGGEGIPSNSRMLRIRSSTVKKLCARKVLENIDKTQKILDTFKKPNTIIKSHQYINSLITNQFSQMTLRMALIYEIGKNKDTKYLDCLKQTLKKENKPLVIETLNWSLLQFEQKRIHTLL